MDIIRSGSRTVTKMVMLKRCCFCFTPRTGTVILGCFGIIIAVLLMVPHVLILKDHDFYISEFVKHQRLIGGQDIGEEDIPKIERFSRATWSFAVAYDVIIVFDSLLLITGVATEKRYFLIPWLVTKFCTILFYIIVILAAMFSYANNISFLIFCASAPFLIVAAYLWFNVYSTFHEMRKDFGYGRARTGSNETSSSGSVGRGGSGARGGGAGGSSYASASTRAAASTSGYNITSSEFATANDGLIPAVEVVSASKKYRKRSSSGRCGHKRYNPQTQIQQQGRQRGDSLISQSGGEPSSSTIEQPSFASTNEDGTAGEPLIVTASPPPPEDARKFYTDNIRRSFNSQKRKDAPPLERSSALVHSQSQSSVQSGKERRTNNKEQNPASGQNTPPPPYETVALDIDKEERLMAAGVEKEDLTFSKQNSVETSSSVSGYSGSKDGHGGGSTGPTLTAANSLMSPASPAGSIPPPPPVQPVTSSVPTARLISPAMESLPAIRRSGSGEVKDSTGSNKQLDSVLVVTTLNDKETETSLAKDMI